MFSSLDTASRRDKYYFFSQYLPPRLERDEACSDRIIGFKVPLKRSLPLSDSPSSSFILGVLFPYAPSAVASQVRSSLSLSLSQILLPFLAGSEDIFPKFSLAPMLLLGPPFPFSKEEAFSSELVLLPPSTLFAPLWRILAPPPILRSHRLNVSFPLQGFLLRKTLLLLAARGPPLCSFIMAGETFFFTAADIIFPSFFPALARSFFSRRPLSPYSFVEQNNSAKFVIFCSTSAFFIFAL